jgi:hypothetical protein
MNGGWLAAVVLVAVALAAYALVAWLANAYSRRTGWQPPSGTDGMNWTLRRNVGVNLGALAVGVSALFCALWVAEWPARLFIVAQAAVMAAAGASDLRRFHLPLPLTLAGFGLAIAGVIVTGLPVLFVLFGLVWAAVVILLHALLSKGSMQLGDHLATLWIAMAAPLNGLIAVAAGDFANVLLARVKGLRGRKVAAAGTWLICAALMVGLPPYVVLFAGRSQTGSLPQAAAPAEDEVLDLAVPTSASPETSVGVEPVPADATAVVTTTDVMMLGMTPVTATALITLSEWAGDQTASVALEDQRAERVMAARRAAGEVARLAVFAARIAPGSTVAASLADLATALNVYDVDGVRNASLALVEEREQLTLRLSQLTVASR